MPFCGECGAEVIGGAKFCPECGATMATAGSSSPPSTQATIKEYEANAPKSNKVDPNLGVTGSVRNYMDSASQAEKDKKTGQQKWGLFETNYQRTKGITTEQSLQEIDNAMRGNFPAGKSSGGGSSGNAGGSSGGGFSSSGGGSSSENYQTAGRGGYSSGTAGGYSEVTATTTETRGVGGVGSGTFKPVTGSGGNALAAYQSKQAAKFAPGQGAFK